ncbi:MAG: alpha/beta hydrolase family protein [Limisphaerales bacterium]
MKHDLLLTALALLPAICSWAAPEFPAVAQLSSSAEPPDPLVMRDGQPVKSRQQWFEQRRPELKALFQHYMYGWFPAALEVRGTVAYSDTNFFGGKATLKLADLQFGPPQAPELHLMLVVPNHRPGPAPVFLGLNFNGNHALVTDLHVPAPASSQAQRGSEVHTWELEQSIDRGYAVATFFCGDVEPDKTNAAGGVRETIHVPHAPDDWGTLAAWAWGMHRAVDYLAREPDLDPHRIAVVGHSRLGKACLLAAAFDERIALAIPLQAGCGGTAPSRGHIGESVERINTVFPHWFCDVFKEFNHQPERLPFDQDSLIALCAPRPVLLGAALEDTWANPEGAFDMLRSADKVYRFLGVEGLSSTIMPGLNTLVDGNLGYFIRPGKHSMTKLDWGYFLDFADKHLKSTAQ